LLKCNILDRPRRHTISYLNLTKMYNQIQEKKKTANAASELRAQADMLQLEIADVLLRLVLFLTLFFFVLKLPFVKAT
jgi:hypothetical protein